VESGPSPWRRNGARRVGVHYPGAEGVDVLGVSD